MKAVQVESSGAAWPVLIPIIWLEIPGDTAAMVKVTGLVWAVAVSVSIIRHSSVSSSRFHPYSAIIAELLCLGEGKELA